MKFLISGRTSSNPGSTANNLAHISSSDGMVWNNVQQYIVAPVPTAMNLLEMVVRLNTAPGAGKSRTLAVYKNGTATSLSVTISDTATPRPHSPLALRLYRSITDSLAAPA